MVTSGAAARTSRGQGDVRRRCSLCARGLIGGPVTRASHEQTRQMSVLIVAPYAVHRSERRRGEGEGLGGFDPNPDGQTSPSAVPCGATIIFGPCPVRHARRREIWCSDACAGDLGRFCTRVPPTPPSGPARSALAERAFFELGAGSGGRSGLRPAARDFGPDVVSNRIFTPQLPCFLEDPPLRLILPSLVSLPLYSKQARFSCCCTWCCSHPVTLLEQLEGTLARGSAACPVLRCTGEGCVHVEATWRCAACMQGRAGACMRVCACTWRAWPLPWAQGARRGRPAPTTRGCLSAQTGNAAALWHACMHATLRHGRTAVCVGPISCGLQEGLVWALWRRGLVTVRQGGCQW